MKRALLYVIVTFLLVLNFSPYPQPTLAQTTGDTVYVGNAVANLRERPSTRAARVARLQPGTPVVILSETNDGTRVSGSTLWFEVDTGTYVGYLHSSLITLFPPVSVAPSGNGGGNGNSGGSGNSGGNGGGNSGGGGSPTTSNFSAPAGGSSPYTCNGANDLNCDAFNTSAAATAHLQMCGDEDRLDADNNGLACESLP